MPTQSEKAYKQKAYPFETKRYCQCLQLKPETDKIEEYKHWHKPENIWKEIPEGIRRAGILNMEIYLNGNMAFMVVETPMDFDWENAFGKLATYERQAEWETFVAKYQMANEEQRSNEKWQLMERIFLL